MPQKAAKYLHRKCRREACSKWSVFRVSDRRTDRCTFCSAEFGRLEVGMDVQDGKISEPVDRTAKREAPSIPAAKLPDVAPGDFEYVDPKVQS